MAENSGQQDRAADAKSVKKLYEKPSFRFEKVFETMALACGKVNATQHTCQFNQRNS